MNNARRVSIGLALAAVGLAAAWQKRADSAQPREKEAPACAVVEYPQPLNKRYQIPLGTMQIYGNFSVPVIMHLKNGRAVDGAVVDGDQKFIRLKVTGGFCDVARKDIGRIEPKRKGRE